jgi:hypothetical protein
MTVEISVVSSFYPVQILPDMKMDRKEIGRKVWIYFSWPKMRQNDGIVTNMESSI